MLHHNQTGLALVFAHGQALDPGKGFTIVSARIFFASLAERGILEVDREDVDRFFVYSMMTIADEHRSEAVKKYHHLSYIEWLEMLCRIAHVGYRNTDLEQEPIAYKV